MGPRKIRKDSVRKNSTLEDINDYCLQGIFQYLNLLDTVNLAATCTRLLNFAKAFIFPKKAKELYIYIHDDAPFVTVTLVAPTPFHDLQFGLSNEADNPYDILYSPRLTSNNVKTVLKYCGEFVEHLIFDYYDVQYAFSSKILYAIIVRNFTKMIKCCHNLEKLSLGFFHLMHKKIFELKDIIDTMQLKELYLKRCYGFTNIRRGNVHAIDHFAKEVSIVKFTLSTSENKVSRYFLNYFTNLTSLTIKFDIDRDNVWRIEHLAKILNNNCQCLQHLKLSKLFCMEGYETAGTLITDKFTKLESLELEIALSVDTKYMIDMPHLKSLVLKGRECNVSVNSYLRTLSEKRIIEELVIFAGVFDVADVNEPPLIFNNLRKFGWNCSKLPVFWEPAIKSQMPKIQHIWLRDIKAHELDELLKFVKSKKSLKLIEISAYPLIIPLAFWMQIIAILKVHSMTKRAFLTLTFKKVHLGKDEKKLLDANRNLIKVQENWFFDS